ncbi:SDR family oxidoreductase [Phenylobacterium sp.]|jgi:short-subunit dehydrogenase|uniref:SDR family NAD(P)-dependent oxidoreductase n=1 Tax=Phenylobacterium sp. TaxID=1871053 RepID=UPI002F95A27C
MSNKAVAVVTGASSGIGAVYAERLAARGYDLLLVARRADRLAQLGERLGREHGVAVETWALDLADPDELRPLEARLEAQPAAVLINNAGTGGLGPTARTGADAQEALIRLNVVALTRLSLAALTGFRQSNAGDLVNIASVVAFSPSAGGASYSGSKAFVLNFTRSLQQEYAGSGIRIQAVLPGPIRTEFFSSQGLPDTVFPDTAYISAEDLVDAALAGLGAGEAITVPTLLTPGRWDEMEAARKAFLAEVVGGQVAERYNPA